MDLLAAVDLIECHGAEDRRQDHSRGVDVDEVLVPFDTAAGVLVGDLGRADGVGGRSAYMATEVAAQRNVEIAVGGVAVVAALRRRAGSGDAGCGDRDDGDKAEALMDLQHVAAAIHDGLSCGAALGVRRRQSKVAERGRAGRSCAERLQTLRGRLRWKGKCWMTGLRRGPAQSPPEPRAAAHREALANRRGPRA